MPCHFRCLAVLLLALAPSLLSAQELHRAQACGVNGRPLFQCSYEDGSKVLSICLDEYERVTISSGLYEGILTVEAQETLDSLYYSVNQASGTSEHVLSLSVPSGRYDISAMQPGRLFFQSNTKAPTEHVCDSESMVPTDVSQGIGQIIPLLIDGEARLADCIETDPNLNNPAACIGRVSRACFMRAEITGEICVRTELDVWNAKVSDVVARANARHKRDPGFADRLTAAQELWEDTRMADCAVNGGRAFNAFVPDRAVEECLTFHAAHRLRFLQKMTGFKP